MEVKDVVGEVPQERTDTADSGEVVQILVVGTQPARPAALSDTMDAVEDCACLLSVDPVLAVSGDLRSACSRADLERRLTPPESAAGSWKLIRQRDATFAERLHHAHSDAGGRAHLDAGGRAHLDAGGRATLQIGMDTPQVSGELLADAVRTLWRPGVDAVLGPSTDGGWWALGLRPGLDSAFLAGIPMSTERTGARTMRAMRRRGLRVAGLPTMTDVETAADALQVAAECPRTRFADAVWSMLPQPSTLAGSR